MEKLELMHNIATQRAATSPSETEIDAALAMADAAKRRAAKQGLVATRFSAKRKNKSK